MKPEFEAEVQHELRGVAERGGCRFPQVVHLLLPEGMRDAVYARNVVHVAAGKHRDQTALRKVKAATDYQYREARHQAAEAELETTTQQSCANLPVRQVEAQHKLQARV